MSTKAYVYTLVLTVAHNCHIKKMWSVCGSQNYRAGTYTYLPNINSSAPSFNKLFSACHIDKVK